MSKFLALFTGPDSIKTPLVGVLAAAIGAAQMYGMQIPGIPQGSPENGLQLIALGLGTAFLAFRVKKSGPTK